MRKTEHEKDSNDAQLNGFACVNSFGAKKKMEITMKDGDNSNTFTLAN